MAFQGAGTALKGQPLTLPETGENVKRTKEGYRVYDGGGSISFAFGRIAGCEAYARLGDFWTDQVSNFACVCTDSSRTDFSMRGPDYIYSLNRTEYFIRLGYDETDRSDTLTLELPEKGRYHLGEVSILYVPMDTYEERIARLGSTPLENVSFSINVVEGTASPEKDCVMVFSIPYSDGWKVYTDGKRAKVLQANVGWLGTPLRAGEHTIRLVYETPGGVTGRWISLAAWLMFLCTCLLRPSKRGRRGE